MRINQKVRYGVACLFELSKNPGEYIDADRIAASQNVPPAYAHKILQSMAHAGMVFALKGVGYRLARPLASITALEVIETLTAEADSAATSEVGMRLEQRINKALGGFTLDQLAAR